MNSGLDGRADAGRTGAGGWGTAAVVKRSGNSAAEGESECDEGTLGRGPESGGRRRKKESVEARGKKDDVFLGRNFSVSFSF